MNCEPSREELLHTSYRNGKPDKNRLRVCVSVWRENDLSLSPMIHWLLTSLKKITENSRQPEKLVHLGAKCKQRSSFGKCSAWLT